MMVRTENFKENDVLVTEGFEGIYQSIGGGRYKKHHDLPGYATFPVGRPGYQELGNLDKVELIKYLDSSYDRLEDYITEIMQKGLQHFEVLEDIVLGILEDTLFFAANINTTFLKNFLKNNAFLDEDWFQCLKFRHWRLGLLDHVTPIDEYDFNENVLENILYLVYKLKEFLTTKYKSNKVKLFKNQ